MQPYVRARSEDSNFIIIIGRLALKQLLCISSHFHHSIRWSENQSILFIVLDVQILGG
jgi:hypothetical protein